MVDTTKLQTAIEAVENAYKAVKAVAGDVMVTREMEQLAEIEDVLAGAINFINRRNDDRGQS